MRTPNELFATPRFVGQRLWTNVAPTAVFCGRESLSQRKLRPSSYLFDDVTHADVKFRIHNAPTIRPKLSPLIELWSNWSLCKPLSPLFTFYFPGFPIFAAPVDLHVRQLYTNSFWESNPRTSVTDSAADSQAAASLQSWGKDSRHWKRITTFIK